MSFEWGDNKLVVFDRQAVHEGQVVARREGSWPLDEQLLDEAAAAAAAVAEAVGLL